LKVRLGDAGTGTKWGLHISMALFGLGTGTVLSEFGTNGKSQRNRS